ncbi:ABC transporter substrate-binding protein [Alkalispirochaeta sphaeroplastigenens]|nr:ABC transporter substrate-binding protein [Alkalispirochaeta sphaeroplastigenens]
MKMRRVLVLGLLLGLSVSFLVSAAGRGEAKTEGFVIGVSNPWVGSEWRTQMVDRVQEVAQPYIREGFIKEVIVQSFDVPLEGQIDQIRNLISRGANVILVNPADANALNPVIREATQRGVIVIATDTEVSSPEAINVAIDQAEWARISARWLVDKLGGEGKIVAINGIAGHPANTARVRGYTEVFGDAPGIEILNQVNADWDNALGQSTMQNLLATYPDINGVWVQDGMAEGALRAIRSAGRDDIYVTGEARVGYLNLWKETGIDGIGVANPPGCMASALEVAVQLLKGRELKDGILSGPFGNTIYVPVPVVVTNLNFDTVYNEYKGYPDYYSVDGHITPAQAEQFFK